MSLMTHPWLKFQRRFFELLSKAENISREGGSGNKRKLNALDPVMLPASPVDEQLIILCLCLSCSGNNTRVNPK